MCYDLSMRTIPQRELRNRSGEILRQAETGEEFTITVEGRPVALLVPYPKRQWVPRADYLRILKAASPDPTFFEDIAELAGTIQDIEDPWDR
jgi:prevent-host-death family protein